MFGLAVLVVSPLFCAATDAASAPVRTVVLDFEVRGDIDPTLGTIASDITATTLGRERARVVLRPSDVSNFLDHEADRAVLGCTSSSCIEKIAGWAKADRIVHGSLSPLADSVLIQLSEIDATTLAPLARAEDVAKNDAKNLADVMRGLVRRLTDRGHIIGGGSRGRLFIETVPPGVLIDIDGRPVGVSPLVVDDVSVGARRVTARRVDGPAASLAVPVFIAEETHVTIELGRIILPDEDAIAAHRTDVLWHSVFMNAKFATCFIAGLAALPMYSCVLLGYAERGLEGNEAAFITASTINCIATGIALPALALGGWGLLDSVTPPSSPEPVQLTSRGTIIPPKSQGDPITTQLTLTDGAMAP